jgi:protein tyrosine phosphatase (PTP) superfamily phosphohydrolase (DUF442 family)
MNRRGSLLVLLSTLPAGCNSSVPPSSPAAAPVESVRPALTRIEADGLHNVLKVTDSLYCGSSPDGEAGFVSLERLGVKTVITVDGARPDVELAGKHRMRYVHLPIGYDGVPQEQAWRIARAIRDLPGPVYLHCHHGKHRGPAAAATAVLCLDGGCPIEAAVELMKVAGTDPHYAGLYESPGKLRRPTREELDALPGDFPMVAPVPALARLMVMIDERWERLKEVRKAGWKTPPGHPDVDPAHEVLQLVEQYRESARLAEVKEKPDEFRRLLAAAEAASMELEHALRRTNTDARAESAENEQVFQWAAAACTRCHAKYRDVPQGMR